MHDISSSVHVPGFEVAMRNHYLVTEFLHREAEILDDNRDDDWIALLDPDVRYRVPMRQTLERSAGAGFSRIGSYIDADFDLLKIRFDRLKTDFAWAEDPPSRARRLVTNIRVDPSEDPEFVHAKSNFLLYRSRYDAVEYQILPGERHDVLRIVDGALRLYRRDVFLDHATLGMDNLALVM